MSNLTIQDLNTVLTQVSHDNFVKFPVYNSVLKQEIEDLNLDTRARHGLKRIGANTVSDVVLCVESLGSIKGIGKKSINKILYAICALQFSLLPSERKENYLNRIIQLNI